MEKNIDILRSLVQERNDLITQRDTYLEKIDADILKIDGAIAYYKEKDTTTFEITVPPPVASITYGGADGTIKQAVKAAVEGGDKFTTAGEITDLLLFLFPGKDRSKFRNQVSVLLSKWQKGTFGPSEIVSYQFSASKKDTVWGRKDWLGSDGKPKEEYFMKKQKAA